MFTRSISAGTPVTELFPGLRAFKVKPNVLARYYVGDVRMLERKEAIKKILEEQEGPEDEEEEAREIERGYSESQRKPRPSGSGMGSPKRKNKVASMMGNSPKISTYFVKKEHGEGATKDKDMEMSKKSNIKKEKDEVKYEQEEEFARAMKMTPSVTFKHEKPAKTEKDLEVRTESGEYFEEYKELEDQLKKEQNQYETVDSPKDEMMEVGNDLSNEVMPMNMINLETDHVNEVQRGERENPNQLSVEVVTQGVDASEAATRSTT